LLCLKGCHPLPVNAHNLPVHSLKHFVLGRGQGTKPVREEQLQGYLQAGERGAGPPPASSPARRSSYPFSRAAFAAASLSTSVA
jgi:hypothetical protein